jgi:hypothetical protein
MQQARIFRIKQAVFATNRLTSDLTCAHCFLKGKLWATHTNLSMHVLELRLQLLPCTCMHCFMCHASRDVRCKKKSCNATYTHCAPNEQLCPHPVLWTEPTCRCSPTRQIWIPDTRGWDIHTSTHPHIYTSTHLHIHTSTHPHVHTSTHPHIYTSTHLYIHTSTQPHIYTSTHPHTYTTTHLHIHTPTHLHIHTSTFTNPLLTPIIHFKKAEVLQTNWKVITVSNNQYSLMVTQP